MKVLKNDLQNNIDRVDAKTITAAKIESIKSDLENDIMLLDNTIDIVDTKITTATKIENTKDVILDIQNQIRSVAVFSQYKQVSNPGITFDNIIKEEE